MADRVHWLVYGRSDDAGDDRETKAKHSSLENAEAQRDADVEHGRLVLRIEDAKGAVVWKA